MRTRVRHQVRIALLAVSVAATGLAALAEDPVLVGTWPGHYRMNLESPVAVHGNAVYLPGGYGGVHVLDVSDPGAPVRVHAYSSPDDGSWRAPVVSGELACFAFDRAVHVVSLSEPFSPRRLSIIDGFASAIAISGHYAYLSGGDFTDQLRIFDLGDPTQPSEVASMTLDFDLSGQIAISKDHAYVAGGRAGLFIVDITNPASPQLVATQPLAGGAFHVVASGNHVYVANYEIGLHILDVSNPATPTRVGGYGATMYGIDVVGTTVFVAGGDGGTWFALDANNSTSPRRVGLVRTPGIAYSGVVSEGILFGSAGESGLQILSVTNASGPRRLGAFNPNGWPWGIAAAGHSLYIADSSAGLRTLNVSEPSAPVAVAMDETLANAIDVAASGDHVYVAGGTQGFAILDASASGAPVRVGRISGFTSGVAVSGARAYLARGEAGMMVVDISDPATPANRGSYNTPGYANRIAVVDRHVFIADGDSGLQVVDVSDPRAPARVGQHDENSYARNVAAAGHLVLVADDDAGLLIYDVSDPADPMWLSSHPPAQRWIRDVAISGNFAYLADYHQGLQVIDISDPSAPILVATQPAGELFKEGFSSVAIDGNYVFLGNPLTGIDIFRLSSAELRLARMAGQVILSWPLAAADYALESAATPGKGSVWSPVTRPVSTIDDRHQVTLDGDGHSAFYRLRKE